MRQERLTPWLYLLLLVSICGSIAGGVPAGADVSAPPADDSATLAGPGPGTILAEAAAEYKQVGIASWYGGRHQGRLTASGEVFDENKLTAAHRTLPLDTRARVTNLANGRSVEVLVNDRGPYINGRVIDLSTRAARELGMARRGLALVRIEVVPEETAGSLADESMIGGS